MSQRNGADKPLKWWQLSLMGVACTIGTGYFLGTGVGIRIGGPGILLAFLLAAFSTFVVFDLLARMTADDPLDGSFCAYANKAFGRWAEFSSGWVYWSSELLIMGSQMAALSLFTRLWFPNVPLWIFASVYAFLGICIIAIGTKGFERMEHVFAVMKLAAIILFILIAALALFGVFGTGKHKPGWPVPLFPHGLKGGWSSMIYAFYSFGGIEVMGLLAIRLKEPKEAPKAGRVMISVLTALYLVSLTLALSLAPWSTIDHKESAFVSSLEGYGIAFVPHLFNAVFIIAGFSTMIASLFAVTKIMVTLAKDGNAPKLFAKVGKGKRSMPYFAFGLTIVMLAGSILMALLMPDSVYEYITTAAAQMLLYNWIFTLMTAGKLLRLSMWGQIKRWIGVGIIVLAVTGTLFHHTSRPGFFISIGFLALIGGLTLLMQKRWKSPSLQPASK
ncbi:amino acid/polyamine/organocation transporter (APC superfamily) [Paenibacillus sp. BK033]|uniref:amino acid permease n=1 Tax=Paenibacillus sp. BK033 TaxID=2512133 RepID=UPI00104EE65A|nr:amino acid permease [Paenibacillus sp. BK033]TCM96352.1 amino acid/polyamine/organocation transporter (APC superfamily) [Paenibacillus sp. BK033]